MRNHIGTVGIVLHYKDLPVDQKFRTLNRTIQDAPHDEVSRIRRELKHGSRSLATHI
jgi:hypothetical protein